MFWVFADNSDFTLSFDDFAGRKIVLISDEAHHLNADTKKLSKDEEENHHALVAQGGAPLCEKVAEGAAREVREYVFQTIGHSIHY